MAPSTVQLAQQLRQFIWYHLDNDLVDNALFLAGRLHAIDPRNPDSVHILAHCHFRAGQLKIAYDYCRAVTQKKDHAGCAYVFAQACLGLERYSEGVATLERSRTCWENKAPLGKTDAQRRPLPDAAAFHCVLGKLAHGNGDRQKAIDSYVAALKLNPFMWDAYERLCDLGANIRPGNVFKESHLPASFLMAFDTAPPPRPPAQMGASSETTMSQGQMTPHIEISHSTDPFNLPRIPIEPAFGNGDLIHTNKATSTTASNAPMTQAALMETPPSLSTDDIALGHNAARANYASLADPPMAPLRKSRIQTAASEPQGGGADVAKLRSTTAKPRGKEGSGDSTDSQEQKKSTLFPPSKTTKRTISGNDPNSRLQQPSLDPAAMGQRRSVRLTKKAPTVNPAEGEPDHKKVKATGTRGRTTAASTVGRVVSGNRKPIEHPPLENAKEAREARPQAGVTAAQPSLIPSKPAPPELLMPQRSRSQPKDTDATSALPHLLTLLRPLASAYYALAQYNPAESLTTLTTLPAAQRETPYVLSLTGRAHHDLNAFPAACAAFTRLRQLVPAQTTHMEIYSTALWHLKRDTDLAFLAHDLVESNRLAPESWCALGNSFALARDHEQAIKCFRRATQLAPHDAYAHTLLGHEHVAAEDLEKAALSYRRAVAVDKRHYQGWYGLGRVYERLGRFEVAERHYSLASSINPRNSVLLCCIGTVQDRRQAHLDALATYTSAVAAAPGSAMGRFKRARSLLRLRRFEEALEEFLVLKRLAPEEANVHFMLGRVYRALGRRGEAVRSLSASLGLDPKAAPLIKDAMEALNEEDEEMVEGDEESDGMEA